MLPEQAFARGGLDVAQVLDQKRKPRASRRIETMRVFQGAAAAPVLPRAAPFPSFAAAPCPFSAAAPIRLLRGASVARRGRQFCRFPDPRRSSAAIRVRGSARRDAADGERRPGSSASRNAESSTGAATMRSSSLGVILGGAVLAVGLGLVRVFCRPALAEDVAAAPATVSATLNSEGEVEVREVDSGGEGGPEAEGSREGGDYEPAFGEGSDLTTDHAEVVLRGYLDMHPDDRKALQALLFLRMKKGEVSAALPVLAKLIELDPDNIEWKFVKAQVDEVSGELLQSKQGYEEILQSKPFSARAWQGLSVVMHRLDAGEEVLQMVTEALKLAVDSGQAKEALNLKMLLGQLHTIQGDLEKAMELYGTVVEEDPTDYRPYLCQGLVFSLIGEEKEAEKCFQQYRKFCPKDFPQRGFLDELLLNAKTESKKVSKRMRQEEEQRSKGQKGSKEMQQPLAGPPRNDDPTAKVPSTGDSTAGVSGKDDTKSTP